MRPLTARTGKEVDGRWFAELSEVPGAVAYGLTEQDATRRARALAERVRDRDRDRDPAGGRPVATRRG